MLESTLMSLVCYGKSEHSLRIDSDVYWCCREDTEKQIIKCLQFILTAFKKFYFLSYLTISKLFTKYCLIPVSKSVLYGSVWVYMCAVHTPSLGKGYRIIAVLCLWEVLLRCFTFVFPTDLKFFTGAFWEATPGTFCISVLWQIVTNCQPYINRFHRIWEMPGAQSMKANWQQKCLF